MRKEIGSEFWEVPTCENGNGLFGNASWFVSGRAAFRAILRQIKLENGGTESIKVALPSYLCDSMIKPLEKEEIKFKFYGVDFKNREFRFDYSTVEDCTVIVLMDYFGFASAASRYQGQGKITVRDLTHSAFNQTYDDADYYFGSLRKWAGFKCGGYAMKKGGRVADPESEDKEYIALRESAMALKKKYIEEKIGDKSYLKVFESAEEKLENCDILACCRSDIDKAKTADIEFIKYRRRENAKILLEGLNRICLFDRLTETDCPLCVPVIVEKRDELRRYLIDREIYCPVHWPKPPSVFEMSDRLYGQELSLPCDQRYKPTDMERVVAAVKDFMESEHRCLR